MEKGELIATNKRGLTGGGTKDDRKKHDGTGFDYAEKWEGKPGRAYESKTTGWESACDCNAETIPCTVLDPFGGSMTVAVVAHKLGRKFIMLELSKTYIDEIGIPRIEREARQLKLF